MAVMQPSVSNSAARLDCALLDFDWSLKYAVASGSIASVHKPLLRLELYVAKPSSKVDEAGLGRDLQEKQMQASIAEFTREELDKVIVAMDSIEQALEGAESAKYS
ncbi:hypothetical protein M758_4G162900 [Ceratodon purpureus]|uniref:COMM domain-containing protein n=1 Tax=Ceratodon purpureus TaxID=3225 RepID=A0A8T0IBG1_CERPU|nr:hypothetical protein KC19_4G162200 [Ceratodon purpureus]KAG0619761.1 hypothetical protein M758_4G162900 [Ceratodon purpureus]